MEVGREGIEKLWIITGVGGYYLHYLPENKGLERKGERVWERFYREIFYADAKCIL